MRLSNLSALLPILSTAAMAMSGCATPMPNALVLLDIPGGERYAVATEDGVIALAGDDLDVDDVPMITWYKGSPILDDLDVIHRVDDLVLLVPQTTRLQQAEFAALEPVENEDLYIQVIESGDVEKRPLMLDASLYADGEFGDLLVLDEWYPTCDDVAEEFAGAGVFARRKGRYVLVGILNGMVCTNPNPSWWPELVGPYRLLPYIALDGLAPVLPRSSNFFERRVKAFRPDFEYGLERDGREPNSINR